MVLPAGFVQPDGLKYDQVVLDATELAQFIRGSDASDKLMLSIRVRIASGTHFLNQDVPSKSAMHLLTA